MINTRKFLRECLPTLVALGFLGLSTSVQAAIIVNVNSGINGTLPAKDNSLVPYYVQTKFETVTAGNVKLTVTLNVESSAFLKDLLFNSNVNPTGLTFALDVPNSSPNTDVLASQILVTATQSQNGGSNIKAGFFNINFTPPSGGSGERFNGTEHVVFNITGGSITEDTFAGTSIADGGNPGGYYVAADFAGFGSSGSAGSKTYTYEDPAPASLETPEPASLAIWGLGAIGCAIAGYRRRKSA